MRALREYHYATREEAADAAAAVLAGSLRATLARDARAALVVSGGTTPGPVFRRLARVPLDWQRVTVLPSDERWVPPDDADSNERLLRGTLLTDEAATASLAGLYRDGTDPAGACAALERDWPGLPLPFAACLLGMGADGHFASLFPDFAGLDDALAPDGDAHFVPVATRASPHPRISLTLAALARSREIVLLFFGEEKRQVFESARRGATGLPVAALLARSPAPLSVVWAP